MVKNMIFCNPPECPSPFYVILSYNTLECIICHKRVNIAIKDDKILLNENYEIKRDYYTVSDETIELILKRCGYQKMISKEQIQDELKYACEDLKKQIEHIIYIKLPESSLKQHDELMVLIDTAIDVKFRLMKK